MIVAFRPLEMANDLFLSALAMLPTSFLSGVLRSLT